jgi:UDP-glucose-4-epimerase GalE
MSTPIGEEHPQAPINPYGATKLIVERMLSDFAAAYALDSVSLRYFNAAGADAHGEIGEDHDPETHLIPLALGAAAGSGPPLRIFGTDYDTPDGTCIRDYIHVSDLASAHVLALRNIIEGSGAKRYNLGNGVGFSVREIIAAAKRVTKREVPAKEDVRRPGDPPVLIADARRAETDLKWLPHHRDIESIIATAWRWMTEKKPHLAIMAIPA